LDKTSSEYIPCTSGFDSEKFDAESTELTVRIALKSCIFRSENKQKPVCRLLDSTDSTHLGMELRIIDEK
jgi:hypothetical protein